MAVKRQAKCLRGGWAVKSGSVRVEMQGRRSVHVVVRREQASRLEQEEHDENPRTLALFLNLAMKDIRNNPSSLEAYTEEMSAEDDELLAGVEVDW